MGDEPKDRRRRRLKRRFYSLSDLRTDLSIDNVEISARDVVLKCLECEYPIFAAPYVTHPAPEDLIELPSFTLKFMKRGEKEPTQVRLPPFPYKQLSGQEFITTEYMWIKAEDLLFEEKTYEQLRADYLNDKPRSLTKAKKTNDLRGKHWSSKREAILMAALQFLRDGSVDPGHCTFFKKDKNGGFEINVSKLASEIDDQRNRWPALKMTDKIPTGTSQDNMRDILSSALKYGTKLKNF